MHNAFSIKIQNIDQYREAQMHKAFSIKKKYRPIQGGNIVKCTLHNTQWSLDIAKKRGREFG